jgi:hypothetical protein
MGETFQGIGLPEISDAWMKALGSVAREYSLMILRAGPKYGTDEARAIIWEHGRRNHALRRAGILAIVCPVPDDSDLCGIGIFEAGVEQTVQILEADPGVREGVFTYEVHPCRGFPGDALPGDQQAVKAAEAGASW